MKIETKYDVGDTVYNIYGTKMVIARIEIKYFAGYGNTIYYNDGDCGYSSSDLTYTKPTVNLRGRIEYGLLMRGGSQVSEIGDYYLSYNDTNKCIDVIKTTEYTEPLDESIYFKTRTDAYQAIAEIGEQTIIDNYLKYELPKSKYNLGDTLYNVFGEKVIIKRIRITCSNPALYEYWCDDDKCYYQCHLFPEPIKMEPRIVIDDLDSETPVFVEYKAESFKDKILSFLNIGRKNGGKIWK